MPDPALRVIAVARRWGCADSDVAREVPILFSGPMVRAILDDRKTETRRIIKGDIPEPPAMDAIHPKHVAKHPAPYFDSYCGERKTASNPRGMSVNWCWWTRDDRQCLPTVKLRWKPGDRLWVREFHWSWGQWHPNGERKNGRPAYRFKHHGQRVVYENPAQTEPMAYFGGDIGWAYHPGIHMPRWASRITLEVAALRVERLQKIDVGDCYAEGCPRPAGPILGSVVTERDNARRAYRELWCSINGPESWDANPWVAVTTFRRVRSTPADEAPDV